MIRPNIIYIYQSVKKLQELRNFKYDQGGDGAYIYHHNKYNLNLSKSLETLEILKT